MAAELFDWFLSAHILYVEKFKMTARFAEPTEAEIVALHEKATPEKTESN